MSEWYPMDAQTPEAMRAWMEKNKPMSEPESVPEPTRDSRLAATEVWRVYIDQCLNQVSRDNVARWVEEGGHCALGRLEETAKIFAARDSAGMQWVESLQREIDVLRSELQEARKAASREREALLVSRANVQRDLREARAERNAALEELRGMEAERDAYRKAKQENDARFMRERDEARSDRDEAHTRGYAAGYQMGVRESSDVGVEMSKLAAERHRQRGEQGRVMMWESTAAEARTDALREASNEILKLLDMEPALRCTELFGGAGSRCKKRQGHASLHSWERVGDDGVTAFAYSPEVDPVEPAKKP